MTLPPNRVRSYLFAALCGAAGALAVIAIREGHSRRASTSMLASAVAGALAVRFEERAQTDDSIRPP